jgi:hypothetical protein
VRLYIPPLFVNYAAQLPFHRFESVVDYFVERFVRAVVHLLFIGNEFVTTRNGHIDTTTVRISFLVRVIGLLNGDVAAVDVIAKSFQPRCIIQNESVDLARFFQTPISDFNRQLHNYWILTRPFLLREAKMCVRRDTGS